MHLLTNDQMNGPGETAKMYIKWFYPGHSLATIVTAKFYSVYWLMPNYTGGSRQVSRTVPMQGYDTCFILSTT